MVFGYPITAVESSRDFDFVQVVIKVVVARLQGTPSDRIILELRRLRVPLQ